MLMLTRSLFTIIVAAVGLNAKAQTAPQLLDSMMRQYAAHKNFSGSVLVAHKGTVLLEQGYGYQDFDKKRPAAARGLYQYGSITKQFTAALILKLQEEGKLNLDDKLTKYYPQFRFADSVNLRQLLNHTSGIYNYTNDGGFMSREAVKPTTQQRIFELFANRPLAFTPGTRFSYSNSNYMLLGYIAEQVTGRPYEQLVRQYILQPAGMQTAGFDFAHLQSDARVTGYDALAAGKAKPAGIVDSSVSYAAGALYGSVRDLYAWHQVMGSGRLLRPDSWQQLYTPAKDKYALGVVVDSLYGKPIVTHGGGIFGFVTDFLRFPGEDLVVVVLCNNSAAGIGDIARNLAGVVLNQQVKWPAGKKEIILPIASLQQYTGEYEFMPEFKVTLSVKDGLLIAQATGQPELQFYPEATDQFFAKMVDVEMKIDRDAQGKITGLTVNQGGREMKAKKK